MLGIYHCKMLPESSQDKPTIILWSNSAGTSDPASWAAKKKRKKSTWNWPDHSCWSIRGTELDKRHHKYRSVQPPPPLNWLVELRFFVSLSVYFYDCKAEMMSQFSTFSEKSEIFSLTQWGCIVHIMSLDSTWVALIYFLSSSTIISQQISGCF